MTEQKKQDAKQKPPDKPDDEDDYAADRARMAEMLTVHGKPKTVLHNAYRGRK